ncbi:MAG: DMT family transporter [Promethearchaeota archaeon]
MSIVYYLLLFIMIFLWGFSFVVVDIGMEVVSAIPMAFYRLIIASIFLFLIDIVLKLIKKDNQDTHNSDVNLNTRINPNNEKRRYLLLFLASLTGITLYLSIIYTAVQIIGPSLPTFTDCLLSPLFITIFSLALKYEHLTSHLIIGFSIASVGAFFLITGGNLSILALKSPQFLGYVLIFLSPMCWSTYSIIIKKLQKYNAGRFSSFKDLKIICFFAMLELGILTLFTGQFFILIFNFFNLNLMISALYLGIGAFGIGYFIWNFSHKKLKSSKIASFLYMQPFVTLIFSIIFQRSQTFNIINLLGGIIVLIALLVINYK